MKILAIPKPHNGLHHRSGFDYLQNSIFHGLRTLYGNDVVDFPICTTSYESFLPDRIHIHGQGFTVGAILPDVNIDRTHIIEKIMDHYFDKIIYLTVLHLPYLDLITTIYDKKDIIFLDGRDETDIIHELRLHGTYFKREVLVDDESIHPINFAYPINKYDHVTEFNKGQMFSQSAPIGGEAAIYLDDPITGGYAPGKEFKYISAGQLTEDEYYDDYKNSLFGITIKKGGWDCMRHTEILFNACLPYFPTIDKCPPRCLYYWDKTLLREVLTLRGVSYGKVDSTQFDINHYSDLYSRMIEHGLNTLTTTHMARRILE